MFSRNSLTMMKTFAQFMEKRDQANMDVMAQKISIMLLESGKTYSRLNEHGQGMGEIYKYLGENGLFPLPAEKHKKSDVESQFLRTSGNYAYKKKDYMEARRIYSKAIFCAQPGGNQIAMAYANRSAVNFELHAYNDAINDINHALAVGRYPSHLMHKLFKRRCKCYLALSQYEKATGDPKKCMSHLVDGDLTLDKINNLKSYLDLVAQNFGKQDVSQPPAVDPPKLSQKPSTEIPCASAAVEVRESDEFWRHVVAAKDISVGDVLAIEKPIVSVLDTTVYEQFMYCEHCLIKCYSPIPCDSCTNAVFCSQQCREESFSSYHSIECDLLPTVISHKLPENLRLAVRALLKATKCGEGLQELVKEYLADSVWVRLTDSEGNQTRGKSYAPPSFECLKNIKFSDEYMSIQELTHEVYLNAEKAHSALHFAVISTCLVHVLKEATSFFDSSDKCTTSTNIFSPVSDLQSNHIVAAELIKRYLMVARNHAYDIEELKTARIGNIPESDLGVLGAGLYGFHSLLNHSCDPDSSLSFYNGDTHVMFAIKPIKKGQQIFISYGPHYAVDDLETREIALKKCFFDCKCPPCANNWRKINYNVCEPPGYKSLSQAKKVNQKILETISELPAICDAALKGECTERQFQTLLELLTFYHFHVERPWNVYYSIQKAIERYFRFKGKAYRQQH